MIKQYLKGYLVEKFTDMGDAYVSRRLKEEAKLRGIELIPVGVCDLSISEKGLTHRSKALNEVDFIVNRYKHGSLKREVTRLATKCYNELSSFEKYVSKYEQVKNLRSKEFIMPKYMLSTASVDLSEVKRSLGGSFVMKGLDSSEGKEVYLIKTQEDLNELINKFGLEKEWLFQEFVASSYGRDVRMYSIRGEVVASMVRTAHSGFKANVALGGSVETCEITTEMRVIARDIYKQTNLDFVGIDLLFGEDKFHFCEINVMPGLVGIEKATGVNVAGKMLDLIVGDYV